MSESHWPWLSYIAEGAHCIYNTGIVLFHSYSCWVQSPSLEGQILFQRSTESDMVSLSAISTSQLVLTKWLYLSRCICASCNAKPLQLQDNPSTTNQSLQSCWSVWGTEKIETHTFCVPFFPRSYNGAGGDWGQGKDPRLANKTYPVSVV